MSKLEGKVHEISETQVITDKFKKRDLCLYQGGDHPQHIGIQFTQDRCDLLSDLNVGDEITVSYNIKGRLWTNNNGVEKPLTNIDGWKIEKGATAVEQPNSMDDVPSEDDGLAF